MTYLLPLIKSPNPEGRIGPEHVQDWFRGCRLAARLQRSMPGSIMLVVGAFTHGEFDESDCYVAALTKLGCHNIIPIRRGVETIEQLEAARTCAGSEQLYVVTTWTHWPRVWWLTRHDRCIVRRIAFGIPRPREFVTDAILAILFPLIDLTKGRDWWLQKVIRRRDQGKL